jgi:GT2 family glycosyltransferase
MADWLCRLTSEDLAQGQWSAEEAEAFGVDAWVISVEAQAGALQQAELLRELFESPGGLRVVLEWCLSENCPLASAAQKLDEIGPWLQHPRAYRLAGRPLLLIRGCEHLFSEPPVADRWQQLFRDQGFEPLPWLVQCCSPTLYGFDGVYQQALLPERSSDPSRRLNYELHLRDAHWHAPPHGWRIPAVRALAANDWDCYRNASAKRYREWLQLVSYWSVLQRNGDPSSPVLLESWGGHRRWWGGEGELQVTSHASSEPIASTVQVLSWGECSAENLALMVHGYYLDGLASMLHRLDPQGEPSIDLYVSTPIRQRDAVATLLRRQGWPRVRLFGVPNRGRDLAPFVCHLLPAALAVGHQAFLKVHTKSSPHLSDGEDWGHHLFTSILNSDLIGGLQKRLQNDSELGLLAPAGTVMPITVQLHNNGQHLAGLQHRWGIDGEQLLRTHFIAGSMFAGRLQSLEPLLALSSEFSRFEPEAGQTDGTFAHALERWIGVIFHQSGQRMDELPGNPRSVPSFGFRWSDQPEGDDINTDKKPEISGCSEGPSIAGQTDDTLAHALERRIGVSSHHQGFRVDEFSGDWRARPGFGLRGSQHLGNPESAIRMGTSQTQPLRGFPLIDSPLFKVHRREGLFGDHQSIADQLHHRGYAVVDLGRARMQPLADRIRADLGAQFDLETWREAGGQASLLVQDAWHQSEAVRELALLPEIAAMLQACWGRKPFAFQTLNFPVGTQQHLHSDAVHFQSEPPGFMCGVWVALEDIHPDAGPLEYVPGSQRLPYLQAADVGVQQQPGMTPDQTIFHNYWQAVLASDGFKRETFTPRLGQALIWSANLIHGGSAVENLQRSRWSQVTHYFFEGCRHYTPMLSDWPEGPVAWRNPFDIAQGMERVLEKPQPSSELAAVQGLAHSHHWTLQQLVSGSLSRKAMEQALLEEAIASREGGAASFSLALMEWALEAGYTSPWLQDNRARALIDLQRPQEACGLWQELAELHHSPELKAAASEMLSLYGQAQQLDFHQLKEALVPMDLAAIERQLDQLQQQFGFDCPSARQDLQAWVDRYEVLPLLLPFLETRMALAPTEGLHQLIDGLRPLRTPAHVDHLLRVSQEMLLVFGWRAHSATVLLLAKTNTGRWIIAESTGPALCRPDVADELKLPALADSGFLASLRLEPGESLISLWLQGHPQPLEIRDLRGLHYISVVDQLLQLCQAGLTPLERSPGLFEAGIGPALQCLAAPLQAQEHWQGLIQRREYFGAVAPAAEITIVIPLYRRWDFMLGHVAGFCQDPWFQEQRVRLLYVIDDPTIETEVLGWCRGQLTDEILDVTVISLQRNSGFALACNSGVQAAETPYVCLLNSDVLPIQPGWLQPLFRTLLMLPKALVAPLLLTDDGRIQHAGMMIQSLGPGNLPACVHSLKGLDLAQLKALSPDGLPYDVELLSGAALMFERQRFLDLGCFDPVFGRGDFEDLEFSIRWKRAGGRLQLVPSARLTHLERQSITHQKDSLTQWRGLLNAWQAKKLCPELA